MTMLVVLIFYLVMFPRVLTRLNPLTGDEPFYVMTAISLLRDHDLNEANNYQLQQYDAFYPPDPLPANWQGWPSFPRPLPPHPAISRVPGLHTKHGLGLTFLIAIPYAIGGRIGADALVMLCAILLSGQMYLLARESGAAPELALLIAIGLAITMPLGPYAFLIFPEIPAALLLIYAIRRLGATANTPLQWLVAGSAIGFLPWLHQRFGLTAAILTAWMFLRAWQNPSRRLVAVGLAPVAAGGIALLLYNHWLYHSLIENTHDHAGFNHLAGTVNGAMGLLLDAQWGLWMVAPITLIALAAVPRWYQRAPRLVVVAISAVVPYFALVAAYKVWWGEWGPAARYLVPVVPFAAGSLAAYLQRANVIGRCLTAAVWGFGLILSLIGYVNPQRFYDQPDGINHLYAQLGRVLHLHPERWLVAFEPYALAPFPERLGISLLALTLLLVVILAVNSTALLAKESPEEFTRTNRKQG